MCLRTAMAFCMKVQGDRTNILKLLVILSGSLQKNPDLGSSHLPKKKKILCLGRAGLSSYRGQLDGEQTVCTPYGMLPTRHKKSTHLSRP